MQYAKKEVNSTNRVMVRIIHKRGNRLIANPSYIGQHASGNGCMLIAGQHLKTRRAQLARCLKYYFLKYFLLVCIRMVASTRLGDHQGRPIDIRGVKQ